MAGSNGEALDILNRRLANGEITSEEYNNLKNMIVSNDKNHSDHLERFKDIDPPVSPVEQEKNNDKLKKYAGYAVIGFVAFALLKSCFGGGNVRITNLRTEGWFISTVSGTIVNDGPSGDVWIWFEQRDKKICPRTTYMLANSEKKFSFDCYDMKEGNFTARASKSPPNSISRASKGL